MSTTLRRDPRRYVAEAIGTAVLVLVGCGAAMVSASTHAFGHAAVALAFGAAVAIVVAAFGSLSGAHVNPAVTIALWSVRRFPAAEVAPYVLAQCVGAVAAAYALGWLLGPVAGLGATLPSVSTARALAIEGGYSAVLAFAIIAVATDVRSAPLLPPIVIGVTVFAGALVTGSLTGGSFSPARSLGPALVAGAWRGHWIYWLAPIAGMVAAMHGFERLRGVSAHPLVPPHVPLGADGPLRSA